jgi:hypothetical protein
MTDDTSHDDTSHDDITPHRDVSLSGHAELPDEALDALVARARAAYHVPPPPDLAALWEAVDRRRAPGRDASAANAPRLSYMPAPFAPWWRYAGLAAAIVLAFTLGRFTAQPNDSPATRVASSVGTRSPVTTATSELLGQTAVLLTALPADGDDPASDRRFAQQAGDLLVTTRLLLDTRAAQGDTSLRTLLEDLELVLAQVARLRPGETRTERELITEALQRQDLVPRIRTIAAGLSVGAD